MDNETQKFLGIESVDHSDTESFYNQIRSKVQEYLDTNPDLLMSYLYRLDVSEARLQHVLRNEEDVTDSIAALILERHLLRLESKKKYKQQPIEGWEF